MTSVRRALIATGRGCAYAACGAALCVGIIASIAWVQAEMVSAQMQQETESAAIRRVAIEAKQMREEARPPHSCLVPCAVYTGINSIGPPTTPIKYVDGVDHVWEPDGWRRANPLPISNGGRGEKVIRG